MFPSSLWIVFRPWLPVRFPLFGNQLQEMGMTRVEREGRVYINPLDLSCVISSLQRQLAHAVACGNNKDVSGCCPKRDNVWGNCSKFLNGAKNTRFHITDTWFIMEVDSNCLHPSIVSVSRIIHVAFENLKEKKDSLDCAYTWY